MPMFRSVVCSLRFVLLSVALLPTLSAWPGPRNDSPAEADPCEGAAARLETHTGWAELPAVTPAARDTLLYAVHWCDGLPGGRNYTVCYDPVRRCGVWSAFALHTCYRGDAGRSDRWRIDPDLPAAVQPDLANGSYRPSAGYARGHLLASNDRTVSRAANQQTFYVTNVAPQWQNSFNGGVWSALEADCWKNVCADTLYVVSGVCFAADTAAVTDRSGCRCAVPTHFYRVLLRSKSGRTGRPVQDLPAEELQCVGFWFENRAYPKGRPSERMVPVAEIECRTGMTFFVHVPQAPKAVCEPEAWNFR